MACYQLNVYFRRRSSSYTRGGGEEEQAGMFQGQLQTCRGMITNTGGNNDYLLTVVKEGSLIHAGLQVSLKQTINFSLQLYCNTKFIVV